MATATEISTRALKRLQIVDALETPSSADIQYATDALNAMIASWECDGLSGDTIPLDSRFEQGITAMLAVRLAEDYGKTPGAVMVRDADNGWSAIQSAFFVVPSSTFENSLRYTGPSVPDQFILGDVTNYALWSENTEYGLRQFAVNGSNLYEVTTAGTSAASGGPTGTSSVITDGTVVWCWRRVTE